MWRILCLSSDEAVWQQLEPLDGIAVRRYRVDHAYSIRDVLEWGMVRHFDVYVLDADLGEGNTLSVCGLVRSTDPDVVIIVMSEDEWARPGALNSGADIFLVKPRETKKLRKTIDDLLDPDRRVS